MGHAVNILSLRANLNFKWSVFFISTHYINYYFDYSYIYLSIRDYLYYLFRFRYVEYFSDFGWFLSSLKINSTVNGFLNIKIFIHDQYYFKFYKKFFRLFYKLMKLRRVKFRKLVYKKKRFNRWKVVRRNIKLPKKRIDSFFKPFIYIFKYFKYNLNKLTRKKQKGKFGFYRTNRINRIDNIRVRKNDYLLGLKSKKRKEIDVFFKKLRGLSSFLNFFFKKKLIIKDIGSFNVLKSLNLKRNFLIKNVKNYKYIFIFYFLFKNFFFRFGFKNLIYYPLFWFLNTKFVNKIFYIFKCLRYNRYRYIYKYFKHFSLNKKQFIFLRYFYIKKTICNLYGNIFNYFNNDILLLLKPVLYKNIKIFKYFLYRVVNLYRLKFNIRVYIQNIKNFRYILMNCFLKYYNKLLFQLNLVFRNKSFRFLNKLPVAFFIKKFLIIKLFFWKLRIYLKNRYFFFIKRKLLLNTILYKKYYDSLCNRIFNFNKKLLLRFSLKKRIFSFLKKYLFFNKTEIINDGLKKFLLINLKFNIFKGYSLLNKDKYFFFMKRFLLKHPIFLNSKVKKFNLISFKWLYLLRFLIKNNVLKLRNKYLKKYKIKLIKSKKKKHELSYSFLNRDRIKKKIYNKINRDIQLEHFFYKLYGGVSNNRYKYKNIYSIKKYYSIIYKRFYLYKYRKKKFKRRTYFNNKKYFNKKEGQFLKKKRFKFKYKRKGYKRKKIYVLRNFFRYFYKLFCFNFRFFFFKRILKKNILNNSITFNLKFFLFIFYVLYYRKLKRKFKKLIRKMRKKRKLIKFFFYKNKFVFKRRKFHLKSFLYLFGAFYNVMILYKRKKSLKKFLKVCYYKLRNWFWFYIFYNVLRRFFYILYIPIKRFFFFKLKNYLDLIYNKELLLRTNIKFNLFKIIPNSFLTISSFLVLLYFRWKFKRKFTLNQIVWPFMRRLQKSNRLYIKGFFLKAAGRFTRRQRASSFKYFFGHIKFSTYKVRLTYVYLPLITKYGKCGLKLWLNVRKKYLRRRFNNVYTIKKLA